MRPKCMPPTAVEETRFGQNTTRAMYRAKKTSRPLARSLPPDAMHNASIKAREIMLVRVEGGIKPSDIEENGCARSS